MHSHAIWPHFICSVTQGGWGKNTSWVDKGVDTPLPLECSICSGDASLCRAEHAQVVWVTSKNETSFGWGWGESSIEWTVFAWIGVDQIMIKKTGNNNIHSWLLHWPSPLPPAICRPFSEKPLWIEDQPHETLPVRDLRSEAMHLLSSNWSKNLRSFFWVNVDLKASWMAGYTTKGFHAFCFWGCPIVSMIWRQYLETLLLSSSLRLSNQWWMYLIKVSPYSTNSLEKEEMRWEPAFLG